MSHAATWALLRSNLRVERAARSAAGAPQAHTLCARLQRARSYHSPIAPTHS